MSEANQEAENRSVRKHVWGVDSPDVLQDTDEMGDTILGNVTTHPTQVVDKSSKLAPLVLAAVLGAGLPAAGVAGYLLSKVNQPGVAQPDESVNLGLGRIEDYLKD